MYRALLVFFLLRCDPPAGDFYFTHTPNMEKGVEKRVYHPTEMTKQRRDMEYYTDQRIWWVYRFRRLPPFYLGNTISVSLAYRTIDWIEILRQKKEIDEDDQIQGDFVIQEPACYSLRLAHGGEIFDRAYFKVKKRGEESFAESLSLDDQEVDEIVKYSKITKGVLPCPP